jgi:hypothetical protein
MKQVSRTERLREAATELWGDAWAIRTLEFADGSTDLQAFHSRGVDDEGVAVRERLLFDGDGQLVHDRVRVTKREQQEREVLDRDVSV